MKVKDKYMESLELGPYRDITIRITPEEEVVLTQILYNRIGELDKAITGQEHLNQIIQDDYDQNGDLSGTRDKQLERLNRTLKDMVQERSFVSSLLTDLLQH